MSVCSLKFKSNLFQLLEHGLQASWDGWLDPSRRWLCHQCIWCTNRGWGPHSRFPINLWKVAGALVSLKGILSHSQNPIGPTMNAVNGLLSSSILTCQYPQTSGQVKRTIGTPANYQGSHQWKVMSRCPWWYNCSISWGQCRTSGSHLSFRLQPLC